MYLIFNKFPFMDRIEISNQEFREDTHPVIKRLENKICKFKFWEQEVF